jgi:hypothetical protein
MDGLGRDFGVRHASDLTVMLPSSARTRVALDPTSVWNWEEHLLADISYSLRWLVWSKTKDGAKNRNHPKRILPPGMKEPEGRSGTTTKSMNKDALVLESGEYLVRLERGRKR